MNLPIHAVTGAFGYTGSYIARQLLEAGQRVITLTNSLNRPNPFGDKVKAYPFDFDNPDKLCRSLEGVTTLYNTYWVRFNHKTFTFEQAITNTSRLFEAAKKAGVQRIVHISITNPSIDSPLDYFRGKAQVERLLMDLGISYAIVRPTILFGSEGVLINNVAWMLRTFPIFGVFGLGRYKLQPVYVGDLANLCVQQGMSRENAIINAVGPETFTFREFIQTIARTIGVRRIILPTPPFVAAMISKLIGLWVHDVMITGDEIKSLMNNLLVVDTPPTGSTKLTCWLEQNKDLLGKHYISELLRRHNTSSQT
ncbi:NAD-dependent epimerase/dehydratase family protein [Anaerohalosphaeraceae bacterium U12dextr]